MTGSDPFEQPVVRDKRRVHFDPASGTATHDTGDAGVGAASAGSFGGDGSDSVELSQLRTDVAERTADLQRVQAEYANYRKRVERDRSAVREVAVADALSALLPVLDDIGRAREHGELEGGFRQVAEALDAAVTKLGLTKFGQAGEPFDPTRHEALIHAYADNVTEPTAVQILQPGYSYAGRVVRPARVAVAEPPAAVMSPDEVSTHGTNDGDDADDDASPSASGSDHFE